MSLSTCPMCDEVVRVIQVECSRPGLEGCREWDVECGCGDLVSVVTESWQVLTAQVDEDAQIVLITSMDTDPEIL